MSPAPVFAPTDDPAWHLEITGFDAELEPAIESVLALVNGYSGTRAALEEGSAVSRPATFIAGVFNTPDRPQAAELDAPIPELVVAPDWSKLRVTVDGLELRLGTAELLEQRRVLDLRQGVLLREWRMRDASGRITRLRSLRYASLANRHVLVQQLAITPENYSAEMLIELWVDGDVANANDARHLVCEAPRLLTGVAHAALLSARTHQSGYQLCLATAATMSGAGADMARVEVQLTPQAIIQRFAIAAQRGQTSVLDKRVVVCSSRDIDDPAGAAAALLRELAHLEAPALIDAHVAAWAARWRTGDALLADALLMQQQVRWALYHLIGAANPADEHASVGARALTGERYRGHVFWDTETFVWPYYLFTHPQTARALLLYRFHGLGGARNKARAFGFRGALYPWEAADTGEETCPAYMVSGAGERVPVLTLTEEHHIAADIAYAVVQYRQATGDDSFFLDHGAEMLLEIARFWASRAEPGADGQFHIRAIVGPDEYHESVDDNAYTNMLAQWVLHRALAAAAELQAEHPARWQALAAALRLTPEELAEWQRVAEGLVTGFDPQTRLFEQFAGYHQLEEIDLRDHDTSVATVDAKLGWYGMQRTKVLKQADVVMLLVLLWDSLPPDVFEPNFRYYEPYTSHDSSLSPSFHALVAARLGDLAMAERYLQRAIRIDLDFSRKGLAGATGGVHIAALGGIWQALAFGFLGMYPSDAGLRFKPNVPAAWDSLTMPIQWRGSQLRVTAHSSGEVDIRLVAGAPVMVACGDGEWQLLR